MGWWKCEHGTIGDTPADTLQAAFNEIESIYLTEVGRLPSQGELSNLIEFITCGCLRPECGDPKTLFSKAVVGDESYPRVAPKGDQGACRCSPPSGKLANIEPSTGEHYDVPEGSK